VRSSHHHCLLLCRCCLVLTAFVVKSNDADNLVHRISNVSDTAKYIFPRSFPKVAQVLKVKKMLYKTQEFSDKSPPYLIPSLTLFIQVNGANWSSLWIRFEDYEESAAGQSLGPFYSKHDVWSASGSATSTTLICKGYATFSVDQEGAPFI
jgi:hypothetical protein